MALLTKYPGRFKLMHLKDLEKGVATNDPTGSAPDETSVVLGTGQLDFPAIFEAAEAAVSRTTTSRTSTQTLRRRSLGRSPTCEP